MNKKDEEKDMIEDIEKEVSDDLMEKRIKMAGELARMEARLNGSYTVYMDGDGDIVKEFPDGRIVKMKDEKEGEK